MENTTNLKELMESIVKEIENRIADLTPADARAKALIRFDKMAIETILEWKTIEGGLIEDAIALNKEYSMSEGTKQRSYRITFKTGAYFNMYVLATVSKTKKKDGHIVDFYDYKVKAVKLDNSEYEGIEERTLEDITKEHNKYLADKIDKETNPIYLDLNKRAEQGIERLEAIIECMKYRKNVPEELWKGLGHSVRVYNKAEFDRTVYEDKKYQEEEEN